MVCISPFSPKMAMVHKDAFFTALLLRTREDHPLGKVEEPCLRSNRQQLKFTNAKPLFSDTSLGAAPSNFRRILRAGSSQGNLFFIKVY